MRFLNLFSRNRATKPAKNDHTDGLMPTYADKEHILAQHVTTQDMSQFGQMPYCLNYPVCEFISDHGRAFAYIDLVGDNVSQALAELEKMNARLRADAVLSPAIPAGLQIPTDDIVFTPSREHGYTRLICTPYTPDGGLAKVPLSMVFMTEARRIPRTELCTMGCLVLL